MTFSIRLIYTFFFAVFILIEATCQAEVNESVAPKYNLSICSMFQNEAPYLKEWIEYHRLLGVEHFYLLNNESTDNFYEVLRPYVKEGLVELIDWPSSQDSKNYTIDQKKAYNYCIQLCVGITSWLAIIDVDEFIVPVDQPDLISYLAQFDQKPEIGAIQVNWQLYGTSWLSSIPENKLLIESLTWKAVSTYNKMSPSNEDVKSIIRPEAVKKYSIHKGIYKEEFFVFPAFTEDRFQPVQIDHIRINHYWTRTEDFFFKTKIARRLTFMSPKYYEDALTLLDDLNQVEDKIIFKWVPELRKIVGLD